MTAMATVFKDNMNLNMHLTSNAYRTDTSRKGKPNTKRNREKIKVKQKI